MVVSKGQFPAPVCDVRRCAGSVPRQLYVLMYVSLGGLRGRFRGICVCIYVCDVRESALLVLQQLYVVMYVLFGSQRGQFYCSCMCLRTCCLAVSGVSSAAVVCVYVCVVWQSAGWVLRRGCSVYDVSGMHPRCR